MRKAIWNRLKNYRCPKCNNDLAENHSMDTYKCAKCSFTIERHRFKELVDEMTDPEPRNRSHIQQEQDNQQGLNNF